MAYVDGFILPVPKQIWMRTRRKQARGEGLDEARRASVLGVGRR